MKRLNILAFLLIASCNHAPLLQKCNGDYICRCDQCDKACKHGDQICRKVFKAECKCK
jgi:hypothetical protein